MSITLEEIAKAAGVSVSTASRALHNSKYAINEDTRQRIIQLAKEMGYSPNLSARGLRGKNTSTVGVVIENVSDPFNSQIARGIIEQLKLADYSCVIMNTDYDPLTEKEAIATLAKNRVDGIIFVHASIRLYESVSELTVDQPFVIVNRIQPPGENTIGLDDYYGSQLAVNHLLKLGRQRIAFIGGPENWWVSRVRLAGYVDALKLRTYPRNNAYIKHGDWEVESGWNATRELLTLPEPPDAIFGGNDLMALGAVYAVQDVGLRVPDDVAIVGHDDREFTQIVRPALSTVRMPSYELGHASVQMLLKRFETGTSVPALFIRGELVVRDSCGGTRLMPSISRSETQIGRDAVVMRTLGNRHFHPLSVSDVRIENGFWGQRIDHNRNVLIPVIYEQMEAEGYVEALTLAWKPGMPQPPRISNEVALAQWMEAASYSLATQPNDDLEALLGRLIDLLARAQQPDGYLNSYYTTVEPGGRFTNLRDNEELRSAGHIINAAIAHHQVTDDYRFLNVALRFADLIGTVFGPGEHQKHGYPGYPSIELALISLYRLTGDRHYLELSRYFINQRGQQPLYFEQEVRYRGESLENLDQKTFEFNQSHIPVREQLEAVGHSGRAVSLYAAMTDLGTELQDETLIRSARLLFESVCHRRMYVTGGIGTSAEPKDCFSYDYDLPNEIASATTEAAVGLWVWMHRMLHVDCDGQYADVMERTLYNAILSSISLDGRRFFNSNPLKVHREHSRAPHRLEWSQSACCAPVVSNLLASLGQYNYSQNKSEIIVHHYMNGSGTFKMGDQSVVLRQETHYPLDGRVIARLELDHPADFTLKLRVPGWCHHYEVQLNGEIWEAPRERGYVSIDRQWQNSDEIALDLDMSVERIYAHPRAVANRGAVALQRGPLVYCLEEVDNGDNLDAIILPLNADFIVHFEPDLLDGVVTIQANAFRESREATEGAYFSDPPLLRPHILKAVPYYAWDNRTSGDMLVWIRESTI